MPHSAPLTGPARTPGAGRGSGLDRTKHAKANALARELRVAPNRIPAIVMGTRSVTADTALRLARDNGTTPEFWFDLQADHGLSRARIETGREIERAVRLRAA